MLDHVRRLQCHSITSTFKTYVKKVQFRWSDLHMYFFNKLRNKHSWTNNNKLSYFNNVTNHGRQISSYANNSALAPIGTSACYSRNSGVRQMLLLSVIRFLFVASLDSLISERVALGSSMAETSRAKESGVARLVAIRLALVLSVVSWSQCLAALGALETSGVPVLSHRRLLLREIDFLLASRTLRHFVGFLIASRIYLNPTQILVTQARTIRRATRPQPCTKSYCI